MTPAWSAFGLSIAVLGMGLGCIFPVVTTAVQNAVPRAQLGTATAAGVMFRQIGGSLAVAVFGAMFAGRMADVLGDKAAELGGEIGPQIMATLPPALQETVASAIVTAIHPIFWVIGGNGADRVWLCAVFGRSAASKPLVPKGE